MFTIINKDGGVWGECETLEEAKEVCERKGYSIKKEEKPKKKKLGRPIKKREIL